MITKEREAGADRCRRGFPLIRCQSESTNLLLQLCYRRYDILLGCSNLQFGLPKVRVWAAQSHAFAADCRAEGAAKWVVGCGGWEEILWRMKKKIPKSPGKKFLFQGI